MRSRGVAAHRAATGQGASNPAPCCRHDVYPFDLDWIRPRPSTKGRRLLPNPPPTLPNRHHRRNVWNAQVTPLLGFYRFLGEGNGGKRLKTRRFLLCQGGRREFESLLPLRKSEMNQPVGAERWPVFSFGPPVSSPAWDDSGSPRTWLRKHRPAAAPPPEGLPER